MSRDSVVTGCKFGQIPCFDWPVFIFIRILFFILNIHECKLKTSPIDPDYWLNAGCTGRY